MQDNNRDEFFRILIDDADNVPDPQQIASNHNHDPDVLDKGCVSTLHKCESVNAKKLCIYDLRQKLIRSGRYDIGGTRTRDKSDLWFFYTATVCPGYNYLLSLMVCLRNPCGVSIGVSSSSEFMHKQKQGDIGWALFPHTLSWFTFQSVKVEETFHIKTYCLSERDIKNLDNKIAYIPMSILLDTFSTLNYGIIKDIKLLHDFSSLLQTKENSDGTLESATGRKYPIHKIVLAAHSPVLRKLIKESNSSSLLLDVSDHEIHLLLEFLYCGTIIDVLNVDCVKLLEIADKYCLKNLFRLAECALTPQIRVENAIEMAKLSEKYNLNKLQFRVLNYIKNNPKVIQTEGWKQLKDVEITKKLVEHIYSGIN